MLVFYYLVESDFKGVKASYLKCRKRLISRILTCLLNQRKTIMEGEKNRTNEKTMKKKRLNTIESDSAILDIELTLPLSIYSP